MTGHQPLAMYPDGVSFGVFARNWDGDFRRGPYLLSAALQEAEKIARSGDAIYAAVVNRNNQALAAFAGQNPVDLLYPPERDATENGNCRLAPEGCPDPVGPMFFCESHFMDVVLFGETEDGSFRDPDLLDRRWVLPRLLPPPGSFRDADYAKAYEMFAAGDTGQEVARELKVTSVTISRKIPAFRIRRLAVEKIGSALLAQEGTTVAKMASYFDRSEAWVAKNLP